MIVRHLQNLQAECRASIQTSNVFQGNPDPDMHCGHTKLDNGFPWVYHIVNIFSGRVLALGPLSAFVLVCRLDRLRWMYVLGCTMQSSTIQSMSIPQSLVRLLMWRRRRPWAELKLPWRCAPRGRLRRPWAALPSVGSRPPALPCMCVCAPHRRYQPTTYYSCVYMSHQQLRSTVPPVTFGAKPTGLAGKGGQGTLRTGARKIACSAPSSRAVRHAGAKRHRAPLPLLTHCDPNAVQLHRGCAHATCDTNNNSVGTNENETVASLWCGKASSLQPKDCLQEEPRHYRQAGRAYRAPATTCPRARQGLGHALLWAASTDDT